MWYNNFLFYYIHIHCVSFLLCITNYHKFDSLKHKSIILQLLWIRMLVWVSCRVLCSRPFFPDGSCDFIRDLTFSTLAGCWYNMVLVIVRLRVPHFLVSCQLVSTLSSKRMPSVSHVVPSYAFSHSFLCS